MPQTITHHIHGPNPRLLIVSGIHGDERGVIDSVKRAIEKHRHALPDFLHIPEVSPSAVARGTRVNADGVDLNRVFLNNTQHDEARAAMNIVQQHRFSNCLSFHEDPGHSAFYLYDSGELSSDVLEELRQCVRGAGITLLNGVDDPDDELLGHEIAEGYKPNVDAAAHHGPLEGWLEREGIASRVFGVEVPGSAPQATKDAIVDVIFECLILGG